MLIFFSFHGIAANRGDGLLAEFLELAPIRPLIGNPDFNQIGTEGGNGAPRPSTSAPDQFKKMLDATSIL